MEAFKKHGVANLKDLSVELMLNCVHNDLIPRLMVKQCHKDGCFFYDNGGDRGQNDGVAGGPTASNVYITPTTREAFLYSCGLSKLCVNHDIGIHLSQAWPHKNNKSTSVG